MSWSGTTETRGRRLVAFGDFDNVIRHFADFGIALCDDGDDLPVACLDLLDVVYNLIVELVMSGKDEDRHTIVDEGDSTMLHLGSWIASAWM